MSDQAMTFQGFIAVLGVVLSPKSCLALRITLSQPAKTPVPSYYCLYSLFNKIRDKGKIVSAGY
jgi:hypothetical protein